MFLLLHDVWTKDGGIPMNSFHISIFQFPIENFTKVEIHRQMIDSKIFSFLGN
jgi:hypothetical protein